MVGWIDRWVERWMVVKEVLGNAYSDGLGITFESLDKWICEK